MDHSAAIQMAVCGVSVIICLPNALIRPHALMAISVFCLLDQPDVGARFAIPLFTSAVI
jgi:hypothetical protein